MLLSLEYATVAGSLFHIPLRQKRFSVLNAAQRKELRGQERIDLVSQGALHRRRLPQNGMEGVLDLTSPTEEVTVHGNFDALGYYYAEVYVGTPAHRFSVIVDTGSSLLAVPCKGCSTCGKHQDAPFSIGDSETSRYVPCPGNVCATCLDGHCGYRISYTEGSHLKGLFIRDKLWLGDYNASFWARPEESQRYGVDFNFGCHSSEGGLFRTQLARPSFCVA